MKQRRTKNKAERLITKPITMRPALIAQVEACARKEDRTFASMTRVLVEEALMLRQPTQEQAGL